MFPLLLLLIGGFIAGFYGAAVGSAGLISIPLLILFGLPPSAAVATSRPAAFVLELSCALRYLKEGKLKAADIRTGIMLGLFGAVGSVAGALVISSMNDQVLRPLFAFVMLSMVVFLFIARGWGMKENHEKQKHILLLSMLTIVAGLYAGFFGFTFGTVMTLLLTGFGFTFLQGAAIARVVGIFTTLSASIVFAMGNSIDLPYAVSLGVGFCIGGWLGAGLSAKKGSAYVRNVLVVVVVASVLKLLFDYLFAA